MEEWRRGTLSPDCFLTGPCLLSCTQQTFWANPSDWLCREWGSLDNWWTQSDQAQVARRRRHSSYRVCQCHLLPYCRTSVVRSPLSPSVKVTGLVSRIMSPWRGYGGWELGRKESETKIHKDNKKSYEKWILIIGRITGSEGWRKICRIFGELLCKGLPKEYCHCSLWIKHEKYLK